MAKDFSYYFAQLRRIEEHREQQAEKEIRKLYKELLTDTKQFVAEEYYKLAEDGKLTFEILRSKGQNARFLEEVEQRLNDISPKVSQEIQKAVEDMYELAYTSMVNAVGKASSREELADALKGLKVSPDMVQAVVENPIAGLTLKDTLEKNRKNVIWDIKREIGIGLTMGDRYETMAKRIAKSLDGDYKKAVTIARTETGRVQEAGHLHSAKDINEALKGGTTNKRLVKTWKTMKDGRVRDQHSSMNGVTVGIDEDFTLPDGTKTQAPKQSGVASQDINCRCYASYDLQEVIAKQLGVWSNYDDEAVQIEKQFETLKKKYPKAKVSGFGDALILEQRSWDEAFEKNVAEYMADNGASRNAAEKAMLNAMKPRPTAENSNEGGFYDGVNIYINRTASYEKLTFEEEIQAREAWRKKQQKRMEEGRRERSRITVPEGNVGVLNHEFGHAIDECYDLARNPDVVKLFHSYTEEEISLGLSSYASESISEFIAECFAESFYPDQGEISKRFMKILGGVVK